MKKIFRTWYRVVPTDRFSEPVWVVQSYLPMTRVWKGVCFCNTRQAAMDVAIRMNLDTKEVY